MSLLKEIRNLVYDEIRRRPYKDGDRLPGVRDLALTYGVSYVTMSNALAMLAREGVIRQFPGKGSFVTDMVSKNSLALFVPDYLIGLRAFDPATGSTCLFGLMDVYAGLLAAVQREGFNMHVIPVYEGADVLDKYYDTAVKKLNVAGAFFMALSSDSLIDRFSESGIPCCKLHTPGETRYNYVAVDIEKGAFKVVNHLIKTGHRRVAMISMNISNPWFRTRYNGYCAALKKHRLELDPGMLESFSSDNVDDASLAGAVNRLLALEQRPAAIFVTSDRWALRVLRILKEKGLNIPGDISVAGFDDFAESKVSDPPLTTVAQPFYELGSEAVSLMKDLLREGKTRARRIIEPRLIVRESSSGPL